MKTCMRRGTALCLLLLMTVAVLKFAVADPLPGRVAAVADASDVPAEAAYAQHIRVKVLEVTPIERVDRTQILKLHVERFYGKIDTKSLDRAKEHETQRFTLLFPAALDADVKPGDLINYKLVGYMKIGRE